MGNSCPLIEKAQSSDKFVKSQNAHGQSQRRTPTTSTIAAAAASSLSAEQTLSEQLKFGSQNTKKRPKAL
jgi:hypothetical protein